ncbi:hypothetical protein CALCODRAFT_503959 [Calocera cornea HHB12733]|uniref:Uncharacterized protein n=1 Tax=Calocera cornea HHB12733 TaxID=1353952 RepID=A0A165CNB9_9BASI|nr:hypothetical protein CALCODRAFT_503959 [Calocera cornea HHB12733]
MINRDSDGVFILHPRAVPRLAHALTMRPDQLPAPLIPTEPRALRECAGSLGGVGQTIPTEPRSMRQDKRITTGPGLAPHREKVVIPFASRTISHHTTSGTVAVPPPLPFAEPPPLPPPPQAEPPPSPPSSSIEVGIRAGALRSSSHTPHETDTNAGITQELVHKRKAEEPPTEEPNSKRLATGHGQHHAVPLEEDRIPIHVDQYQSLTITRTLRTLDGLLDKAHACYIEFWKVAPLVAARLACNEHWRTFTKQLATADGCVRTLVASLPIVAAPESGYDVDERAWDFDAVFAVLNTLNRPDNKTNLFHELRALLSTHTKFIHHNLVLHQTAYHFIPYRDFTSALQRTLPLPLRILDGAPLMSEAPDVDMSMFEDAACQTEIVTMEPGQFFMPEDDFHERKPETPIHNLADRACQTELELLLERNLPKLTQADIDKLHDHVYMTMRAFKSFIKEHEDVVELVLEEDSFRKFGSRLRKLLGLITKSVSDTDLVPILEAIDEQLWDALQ